MERIKQMFQKEIARCDSYITNYQEKLKDAQDQVTNNKGLIIGYEQEKKMYEDALKKLGL